MRILVTVADPFCAKVLAGFISTEKHKSKVRNKLAALIPCFELGVKFAFIKFLTSSGHRGHRQRADQGACKSCSVASFFFCRRACEGEVTKALA